MRCIRHIAILASLIGTVAAGLAVSPSTTPSTKANQPMPLTVSIDLADEPVTADGPIYATVRLTNASGKLLYVLAVPQPYLKFDMTRGDQPVERTEYGESAGFEARKSVNINLEPGDSLEQKVCISRIFDMTLADTYRFSVETRYSRGELRPGTKHDWVWHPSTGTVDIGVKPGTSSCEVTR